MHNYVVSGYPLRFNSIFLTKRQIISVEADRDDRFSYFESDVIVHESGLQGHALTVAALKIDTQIRDNHAYRLNGQVAVSNSKNDTFLLEDAQSTIPIDDAEVLLRSMANKVLTQGVGRIVEWSARGTAHNSTPTEVIKVMHQCWDPAILLHNYPLCYSQQPLTIPLPKPHYITTHYLTSTSTFLTTTHLPLLIPADLFELCFTLFTINLYPPIHPPIHRRQTYPAMPPRSGLRKNRKPSVSKTSEDNHRLPTPTTTVRQRRLAESKTHAANNNTSRKRARIDDEDDEDDEDTKEDEDDHETSGNEDGNTDTTSEAIPNINNYRAIGMEWGLPRADNVATSTPMPPKGVSQGFPERNRIVGSTWSTYIDEEQEVFTPRLFECLCVATHEAYALTQTPLGISTSTAVQDTSMGTSTKSGLEPLTQDELEKYVPVFERLVNLKKVSQDLHLGRLWRHSGKSSNRTSEQLMKQEIGKVSPSWNPATTTAQALFHDEHTSCDRWARLQKKNHLLERFTFESTKAPHHLRVKPHETKPQSASAARQAEKRSELARKLNDLIAPYLRGGYQGKGDAHPKCPELTEAFAKKTFRGDVPLTFHRTPDSQVTDIMLSKGPSCLTNDEVDAWIEDIDSHNYTIVRMKKAKKYENIAEDECNSNSSKCDSSLESVNAQILAELTGPH
ncbi:uncharacterized protein MELLADRAFT_63060 [Melampsora larici-populina 98AG31]|uniref:Uncharacterized protein n=1 Tax=Melampsora larici-populina (strain 98AG31 / pathotype 3-4-7) TaxID=747676 RepID=F4RL54_MELLP|nr:uncharacterized protein MELLADRAFT_63060 [Melampsora larici-populina 98AG31]EGG06925.1 hypothetical protein MELLADRAFT_63060 [Melampsora larici-populina 98AG31]